MMESLYGAFFIDCGNIWLLNKDERRPGGEFKFKNLWGDLALGTGLGLRYDLTFLVLRCDLGVALHSPASSTKNYFNINKYSFNNGLVLNVAIAYPF